MRDYLKNKEVDRKNWSVGPWLGEPNFYEWNTAVGYEAYAGRLETGAWVGIIIAPYPVEGKMLSAFCHTLRDKRHKGYDDPHEPGSISKTDVEGIGEWSISMEHYESPTPTNKSIWGPYKTLKNVIEITESVAKDIFDIHQSGEYKNYFER